jgi:hypothetical protein
VQVVPLQQPLGHVEELQAGAAQAPEVQTWLVAVQSMQATPPLPHWVLVSLAICTQVVPLQHPLGHDEELQPPASGGVQVPLVHESLPGHDAQALPPVPHWPAVSLPSGTQVVPAQQPLQFPPLHEPPSPEVQAPVTQTWLAPQETHAAPEVPHSPVPWLAYRTQLVPLQQPAAQLPALQPPSLAVAHTPPLHVVAPVQVWHVAPFLPHWRLVVPLWQWPALSTQPVQLPPWHAPSALQV